MNKLGIGIIASILSFFSTQSFAVDSISVSYGMNNNLSNLNVFRLGIQWDWHQHWFATKYGYLDGYFDASITQLQTNGNEFDQYQSAQVISVVPMLRVRFNTFANTITPYIEAGAGPAFVSETHLADKDISTNYQFDDRLGLGIQFGKNQQYEIGYSFNHISNANITTPNPGINIRMVLTFKYYFDQI